MSVVIGGVTCQEIVADFSEGIREGGPVAQKKYLCAWSDRYALANAMLGLTSGTSSGSVSHTNPQQYPESRNMWAREIAIKGVGKPTQGTNQIQFVQAIVTVNYGVPQFGYLSYPQMSFDPGQPYVYATQEVHFERQMVTIEGSAVKLANGHQFNSPQPYAVPIPVAKLTISLQKVPYLPWPAIWAAMASPLNTATFLGVGAGYLMLEGADTHEEAATDGTYIQNVTYSFAARQILRWDEVFDPDGSSGAQQVRYNGSAILGRSDLSTLIPSAYLG